MCKKIFITLNTLITHLNFKNRFNTNVIYPTYTTNIQYIIIQILKWHLFLLKHISTPILITNNNVLKWHLKYQHYIALFNIDILIFDMPLINWIVLKCSKKIKVEDWYDLHNMLLRMDEYVYREIVKEMWIIVVQ